MKHTTQRTVEETEKRRQHSLTFYIEDPGPISYRGICPINGKPRLMWYGVSKVSGDTLRLLIGTGRPARSAQ